MPRTVGGRDGSADVILVQRLAAVVLLLSLGVHGIAEEPQPVQHSQQEKALSPHPIVPVRGDDPTKGNLGFIHAFVASFSVIIVSELGDKTFFIAAIMAMRYNRLTVLVGAMLALGVMTCLSVLFGYATTIIPRIYTYYVSTALFAIFGIRMLREGLKMSPDEGQEELEEVQAEIKKKDEELQRAKLANGVADVEAGSGNAQPQRKWQSFISPIFLQALTLTFVAEWGDRSQLTTIILAAREDPFGVAVGGTIGHCLCTGLAVIGGRMIAQKISVRTGMSRGPVPVRGPVVGDHCFRGLFFYLEERGLLRGQLGLRGLQCRALVRLTLMLLRRPLLGDTMVCAWPCWGAKAVTS